MRNRWLGLTACVLLVGPGAALAGSDTSVPAVQGSMVLTGSIVINPDGSVAGYTLDHADKVPAGAAAELAKAIPQWKFEPVVQSGKAVQAASPMSLRLMATPVGNGKYAISVGGARFGGANLPDAAKTLWYAKNHHRTLPRYPREAFGATGVAYVLVEVGRDGTVKHIAVEQVDLYARGVAGQMQQWRQALGQASVDAIKRWKFDVPTAGPEAARDHWFAQIPIKFNAGRVAYGQWQGYLPGPRHFIPWADPDLIAKQSADAIPANGGLYSAKQTLHLLSSLGGH